MDNPGNTNRVPQEPDEARASDDPQTAAPPVHAPVPPASREGQLVFSPHELNQSGEDKEYFHPDKDHRFDAPKDANHHALTPDVEVTPNNKVEKIG